MNCTPLAVSSVTKEQVAVYPNPANDIIHIEGADGVAVLYDMLGQEVGRGKNEMNIGALPAGVYTLVVSDEDKNEQVVKVVKR
jgi:hypothetical protein